MQAKKGGHCGFWAQPSVKTLFFGALLLLSGLSTCLGQTESDTFIVLGAGNAPPWTTTYLLANPSDETVTVELIGFIADFVICPPVVGCMNHSGAMLAPNATTSVGNPGSGFPIVFLRALTGSAPSVRAREFNINNPAQAVDLPVFRVKTLLALNPTQLAFAIRPDTARTNLLLANIGDIEQTSGEEVTVRVGVFSSEGQALGSQDLTIRFGQAAYVVNIGQYLGIPNPTSGQVRVTRIAGAGVFWGILPSLNTDGTIAVGLGAVP